ncbi:MAG: hypothetical protein M0R33_02665 [Methylomonas sp.]|jgi:hypothetical protein|uniref:hypothetical protein n=1 Tax=Methylomonas sp. TaxID=418 RepID=UPI0025DC964A|nr:hypothetical protein [Methylomonas sp.]MCK9605334.1 hypothetical protein [Methylomonas sp.]
MAVRKLWGLRTTQSGCGDIRITFDSVILLAEYEFRGEGQDQVGGLQFEDVIAYRFRDEMHSQGFDTSSYDSVVEVIDSDWIAGLVRDEPEGIRGAKGKKHFAVLLSSNGYLEAVAGSCIEVEPRRGSLS